MEYANEAGAVGPARAPEILLVQNSNDPQERYSPQKSGFEILTIRRSVILLEIAILVGKSVIFSRISSVVIVRIFKMRNVAK